MDHIETTAIHTAKKATVSHAIAKPDIAFVRYLNDGALYTRPFRINNDHDRHMLLKLIHWAVKNDVELRIDTK